MKFMNGFIRVEIDFQKLISIHWGRRKDLEEPLERTPPSKSESGAPGW